MANSDSIYSAKKAAALTNPTSATVWVQSDSATKPAIVYFPDQWEQAASPGPASPMAVKFNLRAWGRMTGGTTANFTARIQFGTSITSGSNSVVFTTGAVACNSTSGNWQLDCMMVWDFTSKLISGYGSGTNGSAGSLVTAAATTQIASADLSVTGKGFVCDALFSASNAGNLAYLDGLTLELV